MSVQVIRGTLDALSPIQHGGDEKTGSTPILRSLTHWDPVEGRHVRLPFFSGNAVRGMLRRLVMHDLVAQLAYEVRSPKLHHALFTGGILESTDETSGRLDLAFRGRIRDTVPPIALFGTSIGNQMVPSCLKVDHAIPICREYVAYLGAHAADPRAQHSVRTFTDVAFATRRDDLKAERAEDEQAHQMKIEFEAFIPGTRFLHGFVLVYASAVEAACLGRALALWAGQPWLGGKSASGYGRVAMAYEGVPDPAPYLAHLTDQRDAVVAVLDEMGQYLGDQRAAAEARREARGSRQGGRRAAR